MISVYRKIKRIIHSFIQGMIDTCNCEWMSDSACPTCMMSSDDPFSPHLSSCSLLSTLSPFLSLFIFSILSIVTFGFPYANQNGTFNFVVHLKSSIHLCHLIGYLITGIFSYYSPDTCAILNVTNKWNHFNSPYQIHTHIPAHTHTYTYTHVNMPTDSYVNKWHPEEWMEHTSESGQIPKQGDRCRQSIIKSDRHRRG